MIFIYIIKLTDHNIYLYHKKKQKLINEHIEANIIRNNKIYNHKKLIKVLDSFIKKHKISERLLKSKLTILINNDYSPADIFLMKYVFNELESIKYSLLKEEELIKERNAIIIWDDFINFVNKDIFFNIAKVLQYQDLIQSKDYIIMGASEEFEQDKLELQKALNIKILEYENSDIILFERA